MTTDPELNQRNGRRLVLVLLGAFVIVVIAGIVVLWSAHGVE